MNLEVCVRLCYAFAHGGPPRSKTVRENHGDRRADHVTCRKLCAIYCQSPKGCRNTTKKVELRQAQERINFHEQAKQRCVDEYSNTLSGLTNELSKLDQQLDEVTKDNQRAQVGMRLSSNPADREYARNLFKETQPRHRDLIKRQDDINKRMEDVRASRAKCNLD